MSISHSEELPNLVQEKSFFSLRQYFNTHPVEYFTLFNDYVANQEWSTENPVLSLKAFALLDPKEQRSELHQQTLRVIFAAGVLAKDDSGIIESILMDAVRNNNWDFIFKLIEHGVPKDITLVNDDTLLHLACSYSMPDKALKLLELGVSIDPVNSAGKTPLYFACKEELEDVCGELLERGANPLADDEEGYTPLYLACEKGNESILEMIKQRLDPFEWQVQLAATFLELDNKKEAQKVIEKWRENNTPWNFIRRALKLPHLMPFLLNSFREGVNACIQEIRKCSAELKSDEKQAILPLLPPSEIVEIIEGVPDYVIDEWMKEEVITDEEEEGRNIIDTVERGLYEVNGAWIQFIDWNDTGESSNSGWLINKLCAFLGRIPLPTLSAVAMSDELSYILEPCFGIMDYDQVCVTVPHYSPKKFTEIVSKYPILTQINILRAATDDQKHAYIEKLTLPASPLVQKWYQIDYEDLQRGIEKVTDAIYLGKAKPLEDFKVLLEKFEDIKLRLPFAAKQNLITFDLLKSALLINCKKLEVRHFVVSVVSPMIYKSKAIEGQLKQMDIAFQTCPLYSEAKESEEKEPPEEFLCGIMQLPMTDPVTAHGHTFDREAIQKHLEYSNKCPICRIEISLEDFETNHELRERIENW